MSKRFNGNSASPLIHVDQVYKSFDKGTISVLKGVTLSIREGDVAALWGASGSGKTTLLHLLGGLDTPDSGDLKVAGLNPALEADRLPLRREKIGFVFQLHNLIPDLTLKENCLVTSVAARSTRQQSADRFQSLAEQLGIEHRQNRRIQELSGGERQRVALCRALMHRPQVILADEPTGSLDEKNGTHVFEMLKEMARRENVTVVMATHERRFADACDRIFQIRDGHSHEI